MGNAKVSFRRANSGLDSLQSVMSFGYAFFLNFYSKILGISQERNHSIVRSLKLQNRRRDRHNSSHPSQPHSIIALIRSFTVQTQAIIKRR